MSIDSYVRFIRFCWSFFFFFLYMTTFLHPSSLHLCSSSGWNATPTSIYEHTNCFYSPSAYFLTNVGMYGSSSSGVVVPVVVAISGGS